MRDVLCRKQTCTVTVIRYCSDDRQLLIALAPAVIDPIGMYWRFVSSPPAFDAPVREVPVGILLP